MHEDRCDIVVIEGKGKEEKVRTRGKKYVIRDTFADFASFLIEVTKKITEIAEHGSKGHYSMANDYYGLGSFEKYSDIFKATQKNVNQCFSGCNYCTNLCHTCNGTM